MRLTGILGGMGPEATVLLMQRLIEAQPAKDDADHVPVLVFSNPQVPSRIKALIERTGPSPAPVLADMARRLEAAGAEALAMPCNTAHAYADDIRAAVKVPFIDMVAETAGHLAARHGAGTRVGFLASPAVRLTGVFDAPFADRGLVQVYPEDDAPVLALIRAVKAGRAGAEERAELARLATRLANDQDCAAILVACTELSLLTGGLPEGMDWTDSLDCLVEAIRLFATR
ncbi:aspartate/glutamate racemase family protein [Ostreiculturibacter nitratireducens]|uniref:aspartate/glutamate racemase family protein n=1 Tax=Ostreiculturibacter nitratireducens TaxID=3075226 RepID=UPI0031B5AA91